MIFELVTLRRETDNQMNIYIYIYIYIYTKATCDNAVIVKVLDVASAAWETCSYDFSLVMISHHVSVSEKAHPSFR